MTECPPLVALSLKTYENQTWVYFVSQKSFQGIYITVQTDWKTNTQGLCSLEKRKGFFFPTSSLTSPEKLLTWNFILFLSPRREIFQLVESKVTLIDV